ncbi:MAG TPA: amino acid adenylation domain-containing protein [Kofleriaceae bacterium]|jgi:amino acid adenylation domain-containing protein
MNIGDLHRRLLDLRDPARITPRATVGPAPLSSAQQRMRFLEELYPNTTTRHVRRHLRLHGKLDTGALTGAFRDLQARHEILRSRFPLRDGVAIQEVVESPIVLVAHDLRALNAEARTSRVAALLDAHDRPFDLERSPPWRIELIGLADDEHLLWITLHHIITDNASMRVMMRELGEHYAARAEGRATSLALPPIQFSDYAAWEQARLSSPERVGRLDYWRQTLRSVAPLQLPARSEARRTSSVGASLQFEISAARAASLRALATAEDSTLFMVLLAAFDVLLSRYGGSSDVAVGTPVANRMQRDARNMLGLFVNTIVVRTQLDDTAGFREVVHRVRESLLDGLAHQDVPYDRVLTAVNADSGQRIASLFNVMIMQYAEQEALRLGAIEAENQMAFREDVDVDLTLSLYLRDDGPIAGTFVYAVDALAAETVEQMCRHFQRVLDLVIAAPDAPLVALDLLSTAEHAQLADWNATERALEPPQLVHELVAAQATRTPDAIAVEDAHQRITYRELTTRVDRIAGWLATHGASRGARVVVSVSRSAEMVAAVLGVLRTGAAYVPIDPEFPELRRELMRADAGAALELDDDTLRAALASKAAPPRVALSGEDAAYILYTSGSTGHPKGVAVPHRAVVNFLRSMQREPGITARDTLVAVTTLSFDIAGLELYLPLVAGAKVVIADRDTVRDGDALARLLDSSRATLVQATPATWRMLLAAGWQPSPELTILCGGEALPPDLASTLLASARALWNLYGPTETTIWSTVARVEPGRPISIGRPIDNTTIYILDEHRCPVPIGVAGELYIGGRGVALGYYRRPDLTAERFVADPFAPSSARMYRTGDAARWTHDGTLEHLGRLDSQIKLRGFRIELGEIETALRAIPGIRDAAVAVFDEVLVGYLVQSDDAPDAAELLARLRETLPSYMLPAMFVPLPTLPLTANSKLDRKALPAPELGVATAYVAPRNDVEATLAQIWSKLLRVERVGIHDDFFALGGHSLLAIRVIAEIERCLGVRLPLRDLFVDSTLGELAARVGSPRGRAVDERPRLHASAAVRTRMPAALRGVFKLDKLERSSFFARHVWSAWIDGPLELRALEQALAAMRERHALLRARFFDDGELEMLEILEPADVARFALLERVDLSSLPAEKQESADAEFHRRESFRPLDIGRGEVMSVALSMWSPTRHRLSVSLHNIVSDAETLTTYVRELHALWCAFAAEPERDPASILPPVSLQYHHLADYLERFRESEAGREQRSFWKAQVEGLVPLQLPIDSPREAIDARREANAGVVTFRSKSVVRVIPLETLTAIEQIAKGQHASVMSTLVAAMASYLTERTAQRDITLITRLSHRYLPGLERTLGFLVNPILLRVSTDGEPAFSTLVARTHAVVTDAFDQGESDLFEIAPYNAFRFCLVYTRPTLGEGAPLQLPATITATRAPHPGASDGSQIGYDLLLWLSHLDDRIVLSLAYNLELFRDATAATFLEGYIEHLTAALLVD